MHSGRCIEPGASSRSGLDNNANALLGLFDLNMLPVAEAKYDGLDQNFMPPIHGMIRPEACYVQTIRSSIFY